MYRSVKLRLTNEQDQSSDVFASAIRLVRIIQPWALTAEEVTWNQYDRTLTAPAGNWGTGGGRGSGVDFQESVLWTAPFPNPTGIEQVIESPDISALVDGAIQFNSGILNLMVQKTTQSSGSSSIVDFHSSRAPGQADANTPHLFFDAF